MNNYFLIIYLVTGSTVYIPRVHWSEENSVPWDLTEQLNFVIFTESLIIRFHFSLSIKKASETELKEP